MWGILHVKVGYSVMNLAILRNDGPHFVHDRGYHSGRGLCHILDGTVTRNYSRVKGKGLSYTLFVSYRTKGGVILNSLRPET